MSTKSQQLLDLHVAHELEQFSSDTLKEDVAREVSAFFTAMTDCKLEEFATAEQITATIKRDALEIKVKAGFGKWIHQVVASVYALEASDDSCLGDLLSASDVEAYLDQALSLQELRAELIHRGMRSELYRELVGDLLYAGISSYITEGNAISKNVPGAKKMMSMGKGLLNKAAPKLEGKLEEQVKKYITSNLSDVIEHGEQFITESITDAHIKDIAMGIWDGMADKPIAVIRDYLSADDLDGFVELIYPQILKLRQHDYVYAVIDNVVSAFFAHYGGKKLSVLLKDLGITEKLVVDEIMNYAPSLIETLKHNGYLEDRLRARLERFYQREDVAALLG